MNILALNPDRRRLEISVIAALVFWILLLTLLSFIQLKGPDIPENSMNPVYVELAPPEQNETPPEQQQDLGGRPSAQDSDARISSTAQTQSPAASQAAQRESPALAESGSQAGPEEDPAAFTLRDDPGLAPVNPSLSKQNAFQGGADPFAPLSDESLNTDLPPAPVDRPAPAAGQGSGSQSSPPGPLPDTSGSTERDLGQLEKELAQGGTSGRAGNTTGAGQGSSDGTSSYPGGLTEGGGDVYGEFDFGSGVVRQLLSPRRIIIPDRLLAGEPDQIVTRISFRIDGGGLVYPGSIHFDPPLKRELDAYLRAMFASWSFTPADSDGQVTFMYSIKVR